MSEVNVTMNNFDEEVMKADKPVLIDFWASWCGPCKMIAPIVSVIAEEYAGRVKVCKVNVDDEPELANAFKISSIPTLVVVKDGKVTNVSVGLQSKSNICALLGL
ncbi:MAG: thioredoxin [Phascolarctobacterium sp.]|nr:thioredoxin [Phascolarctobacterium sp.]